MQSQPVSASQEVLVTLRRDLEKAVIETEKWAKDANVRVDQTKNAWETARLRLRSAEDEFNAAHDTYMVAIGAKHEADETHASALKAHTESLKKCKQEADDRVSQEAQSRGR